MARFTTKLGVSGMLKGFWTYLIRSSYKFFVFMTA
jgi:hypothetical protein